MGGFKRALLAWALLRRVGRLRVGIVEGSSWTGFEPVHDDEIFFVGAADAKVKTLAYLKALAE